jgi:type II secretory pathway component GspD/PulD (secretin)
VVVEDGSEGEIKITREDLFLILSGGGQFYNYFTTKDVETGVIMKVKPFISRDGILRLVLKPEISDIIGEREFKISGSGSQKLPIIARRSETTTVRVENGKTIAIGGLLMQEKRTKTKGVPGLSSMPVVGSLLFGGVENSEKDVELVIFITPRVIF